MKQEHENTSPEQELVEETQNASKDEPKNTKADTKEKGNERKGKAKRAKSKEPTLEQEVETLEARVQELEDKLLRVRAEYENYRKRTTKEKSEIYPDATAQAIGRFLPILDNFERSMEYDCGTKEFKEGIDLIYKNFQDILNQLGVEAIGQRGEPFDPELHNAVMHCQDEELGENTISQVLQKGYKMGDRIIRHAMVETAN